MIERFIALGLPEGASLPAKYPHPALSSTYDQQELALQKLGLPRPQAPVLALCPGAEFGSSKRWPAEHYAQLADAKIKDGWQVWLFGSPKDKFVTQEIMNLTHNRCVDLAGRTKLEEAIDLLALSTLVVSNDSGLMHVAAALNKPIMAIYGSTSPSFTPPLTEQVAIEQLSLDCQPCFQRECPLGHHRCMRDLSPQRVLAAIEGLSS